MLELKTQLENTRPLGWVQVLISDVLEVHYGKGLRKSDRNETGQVPVYGSSGIVGYHTQALTDGACIVIGRKGSVGTVYLSNVSCWPIDTTYFSQPPDGISLKYAYYALQFLNLGSLDQSTTIPGLNRNDLYAQSLPLAPTEEQKRIVDEIEKQFTRLDMAVSTLQKVLLKLEHLRAAILKAACEGKLVPQDPNDEPADILLQRILEERRHKWEEEQWAKQIEKAKKKAAKATRKAAGKPLKRGEKLADEESQNILESTYSKYLPKNDEWKQKYKEPISPDTENWPSLPSDWTWATIEQLAAHEPRAITDGPFGSKLKTSHYTDSGPRVIRLQNIGEGNFIDQKAHISQEHFKFLHNHRIFAGDLVIAGLGKSLPRACMIPNFVGPAIVKADCIRFKPNPAIAHALYLNYVLNSEPLKKYASTIVHGISRPRLNQQKIKTLPIPLPPRNEQNFIAEEIERRLSIVQEIEKDIAVYLTRATKLRRSILKKAFSGQLVPQEPTDEPANLLLGRIREEREKRAQDTYPAKKKKKQTRRNSGGKMKKERKRRSLYEVLVEPKAPMSAVELFHQAGFKAGTETVLEFYEELRKEVPGRIEQIRPNKADVYLKAVVNET
jgi:type I restriction enzyme S subunit